MREELLKIAENIDKNSSEYDWFNSDFLEMKRFISKELKSVFKKKKANELIDNMDILLRYTNSTNTDWICYDLINMNSKFVDALAANLKHFNFKEHIGTFLSNIHLFVGEELFSDKLIKELSTYDLNKFNVSEFYNLMTIDQRLYYLENICKTNKPFEVSCDLYEEEIEFIEKNINHFTKNSKNLFFLKRILKDKDAIKKLEDYMDNNIDSVIDSIMTDIIYLRDNNNELRDFLSLLIKDIIDSEKTRYSQINQIGKGASSIVLLIGDKVLKIGENRRTPVFPNNPYIIKPLMRKELSINKKNVFIEVCERVETLNSGNIDEEKLYQLYKGIRDLGLIWTDIAPRNIGKLLHDNKIYWKEEINPSDQTLSLEKYRGNIELKKGDYVVLDADIFYKENDLHILYVSDSEELVKQFEERYQNEKKNQQNKKRL